MSCDASTGEGVEEAPASRGIDVGSLLELLPHGLVLPQVGDEFLQDVADPAGAEQLAALGPGDRGGVAGHDREPEVRAERLGG